MFSSKTHSFQDPEDCYDTDGNQHYIVQYQKTTKNYDVFISKDLDKPLYTQRVENQNFIPQDLYYINGKMDSFDLSNGYKETNYKMERASAIHLKY